MATGDIKEGHSSEATIRSSAALADATAANHTYDNSSNKYDWAIVIVNITAGTGSDADGVILHFNESTDGGSSYTDAEGHPFMALPSPNSSTVTRHGVLPGPLGPNPRFTLKNDSGASITAEITARFGYYNVAS